MAALGRGWLLPPCCLHSCLLSPTACSPSVTARGYAGGWQGRDVMPSAIPFHVQTARAKVTLLFCIPVFSACSEQCAQASFLWQQGRQCWRGHWGVPAAGEGGTAQHCSFTRSERCCGAALPSDKGHSAAVFISPGDRATVVPTYPGSQHIPTSRRPSPAAPGGANA